MIKVYIASRYRDRDEARRLAHSLPRADAICVCEWFDFPVDDYRMTEEQMAFVATTCHNGIRACDLFVHLSFYGLQRGGNLVELGMALAFGKPVLLEGPVSSVFHRLEGVQRVPPGGVLEAISSYAMKKEMS